MVVFQPLGASDYLETARLFDTVFIRYVPMLTLTLKDQARRFTTLIDNFYDNKVCNLQTRAVYLSLLGNITSLHYLLHYIPIICQKAIHCTGMWASIHYYHV